MTKIKNCLVFSVFNVLHIEIISPVHNSEENKSWWETNPGENINFLRIKLEMFKPEQESVFRLLNVKNGGSWEPVVTSVHSSYEGILGQWFLEHVLDDFVITIVEDSSSIGLTGSLLIITHISSSLSFSAISLAAFCPSALITLRV